MHSLQVEQLGKRYWVTKAQPKGQPASSMRDRLRAMFSKPLPRELAGGRELWALRDVSFHVDPGTVLGVIGANGAGKTTLLKVISKVISPTTGRVRGRGRVVSLLELGAGFDEEATARENIYMNAAMHGIPRAVVQQRFDNIVDFAELSEFVDTELQYYSSGMYLRLAFSVAINMEPSILLADEILAVGDITFQERCLQKVRELARDRGLTVLFVSHDMQAVARICDRVIWLKAGELHRDGAADSVVAEYQNASWEALGATLKVDDSGANQSRYGEIVDVKLLSADGREIGSPPRSTDVYVRIRFRTRTSRTRARCSFELYSRGVLVLRSLQPESAPVFRNRIYQALVRIPANLLSETTYSINAGLTLIKGEGDEHPLVVHKALSFMVYADHGVDAADGRHDGMISPELDWNMPVEIEYVGA